MEYYIGQVIFMPNKRMWNLKGFLKCDGSTYFISDYQALASLLGDYGKGNKETTFTTPVLHSPIEGYEYFICHDGLYPRFE